MSPFLIICTIVVLSRISLSLLIIQSTTDCMNLWDLIIIDYI